MTLSIPDFWNLATESRLLTTHEVEQLAIAFSQVKGATAQANARTLAEWLIARNVVSRYQAHLLLTGQRGPFWFGDYKVYDHVDSGSLAGAYRAVHASTNHPVLLHFASAADATDAARWSIVSRHAKAAVSVQHLHLRRCYELVDLGRFKFLVTEDPPGRSLDTFLAPGRPLPVPDACRLARQVASALAAWHAAGLVHGTLLPDQAFVTPAGNVRLVQPAIAPPLGIDFAVLGRSDDTARRLAVQLDYLAPEQFQPGRPPDSAADIYALGCLLFQMVAGRVPFPVGDARQKALAHATQPIAPLATLGVPQPLVKIVSYMMAKDPAVRYQSAAQVADALAPFIPPAALVCAVEAVPPTAAAYQSHLAGRNQPARIMEATSGLADVNAVHTPKPGATNVGNSIAVTPTLSTSTATTNTRPRRRSNLAALAGIAAAAVAAVGLAIYLFASGSSSQSELAARQPKIDRPRDTRPPQPAPKVNPTASDISPSPPTPIPHKPKLPQTKQSPPSPPVKKTDPPTFAQPPEEVIDDDQKMLWASPTSGAPLELKYVGLGAQAALVLRPAALLADAEGAKIIKSLGPAGHTFVQSVESAIGVPLADVEQLTIALYPNGDLPPRASYVVRLKSEIPKSEISEATLAKNWKNVSPSKTRDGKKLYAGEAYAYYLPAAEKGRVFAAGAVETIQEVAELDGKEPTLVVPFVKLLRSGDNDRHVTFVCEPRLLFGDGRKLFDGASEKLREPLSRFLGDDTQAASVSLHLADDRLFLELRAIGRLEAKPDRLAQSLQARVANLPKQIDDFLLDTDVTRHSKKLLNRFPQMLRELVAFLRADADHDEAILRCYLPAVAAHNFARAAELALHEGSGAVTPVAHTAPTDPSAATLAARLDKKITLAFPRDTLERSIELWAAESGVKAVILGSDLQLDGITKNQSFGLDEMDQPALAVLRQILKKASPDGKLIYVIKPEQAGGPEVVFITTLTAAIKRGDKLPPGIQPPKTTPKRKV